MVRRRMAPGSLLTHAFNTAYELTVQTQPTNPSQTCVVTNGTGMIGTSNVTNIVVTCTTNPPRFAYVANRGSNNVSAYTVMRPPAPWRRSRAPLMPSVTSQWQSQLIPRAPTPMWNQMDATISAFTIDHGSGVLTEITGSPFATGASPTSVAIDPSTSFLYVTNGSANTVSAYSITTGSWAH